MARTLERGSEPVQAGRVRLAMVCVALVFALFAGRLFQLQLIEGEELLRRSERNSVRTVRLEAPRGEIVDREGRILATTRPAFGLEVVPDDVRDRGRTFAALGQLLGEEPGALEKALGKPSRAGRFKPVRLADDLSPDQLARVEVHRYALAGVATEVAPRRHYLEGDLAAHLLGSLGEIRGDQLERDEFDGYRSGDVIGQSGLESTFESVLRGVAGGRNVVVDVAGREMDVLEEVKPRPGRRVVLAIDLDLQRVAEQAMRDVELPNDPRPTGAVVALDVRSGDVLAMVSRPAYDPNDFAGRIDSATWKGAHDRRVGAAPEPGDPEPVPARLDLQGVRRRRRPSRGRRQRAHDRVLPGVLLVRRARLPLLAPRRPRDREPAPGAAELVRRLLLHDGRQARDRPAALRHLGPRPRAPDGHRPRPRGRPA